MSSQPFNQEAAAEEKSARPPKPTIIQRFGRFLFSLLKIYIVLVVVILLFQSKLMYVPFSTLSETPQTYHLAYEDVTFTASDGVTLNGWFLPADKPRGVVLLCHGNAGNISHRLPLLSVLNLMDLSVFIFDYRGYGLSEGSPNEEGTYLDAEAAWNYLVDARKISPEKIILMGRSMGGSIAAHLAGEHTPAVFILESAFTSVKDLAAEKVWFLPVRWLIRYDYGTADYLSGIKCPILVIHSGEDEIIPVHHGQKLYELAPQLKQWLEISGSHNDGFFTSGQVYTAGIEKFLNEHMDKKMPDSVLVSGPEG